MTIAILTLILLGYVLIANEHLTHINKATIALFAAVLGWILFISTGTDFVMKMHGPEFSANHLSGVSQAFAVKQFIADHIFLRYGAQLGAIALYLLATMNIVSVLESDGCFEFIARWSRVRSSCHLLWILVGFTFVISANLDNLTTTVLMLMILRKLVSQSRWRMFIGSAIVIAANCGGTFTVIGDVTSLVVWGKGAVTPTNFSAALVLPALVATVIPTAMIARSLPEHIDLIRPAASYRGDSLFLSRWQRVLLLIVGIGGLWFIPTFHRITLLPPFLGALCVLGVLWVLHELFNHRRITSDQPLHQTSDRRFQYLTLQTIMYFVGVFLCVSLLIETGVMRSISAWCDEWIHNIYIMSIAIGAISSVLDNIALVLTAINIYPVAESITALPSFLSPEYSQAFLQDGQYWHLIIYSGCVGGCLLPIGNVCGYALMRGEDVSNTWYVRHIMPKVFIGWMIGLALYFALDLWLR